MRTNSTCAAGAPDGCESARRATSADVMVRRNRQVRPRPGSSHPDLAVAVLLDDAVRLRRAAARVHGRAVLRVELVVVQRAQRVLALDERPRGDAALLVRTHGVEREELSVDAAEHDLHAACDDVAD